MQESKLQLSGAEIMRVTYLGVAVNILLSIVKVVVGLAAGSIALVADGIHSISDIATDVVVLLGAYFGTKDPDPENPYGHAGLKHLLPVLLLSL